MTVCPVLDRIKARKGHPMAFPIPDGWSALPALPVPSAHTSLPPAGHLPPPLSQISCTRPQGECLLPAAAASSEECSPLLPHQGRFAHNTNSPPGLQARLLRPSLRLGVRTGAASPVSAAASEGSPQPPGPAAPPPAPLLCSE